MDTNYNTRITLIQRAKDPDDHEAWEEFVRFYRRFIYYILNKMNISIDEIDDLVQEILLSLWGKLPEYEQRNAKFRSWLGTVIRNTALNYIRDRKRHKTHQDSVMDSIKALSSLSDTKLEQEIEQEWKVYLSNLAMEQLEQHIPGKALSVFMMSLDGTSTEIIAKELEITVDSVYTLKNRVKTRLAKQVSQLMEKLEF